MLEFQRHFNFYAFFVRVFFKTLNFILFLDNGPKTCAIKNSAAFVRSFAGNQPTKLAGFVGVKKYAHILHICTDRVPGRLNALSTGVGGRG